MVKTETLYGRKNPGRRLLGGIVVSLLLLVISVLPAAAQLVCTDDARVPDEMVIELKASTPLSAISGVLAEYDLTLLDSIEIHRFFNVLIPPGADMNQMEDMVDDDQRVADARAHRVTDTPEGVQLSIPDLGINVDNDDVVQQPSGEMIHAPEAQQNYTGRGVVIAVIDTGFALDHPDFANRIVGPAADFAHGDGTTWAQPDFLDNDGDGLTDESLHHGTFVAGVIHWIAPGASILPIRALDADGTGGAFRVAMAIHHAIDHGAHVINMSQGMLHDSRPVERAVERAHAEGVIIVAAAGNRGEPNVDVEDETDACRSYPASFPGAIAVAAVDEFFVRTEFSDYGPLVDLSAPGLHILSTFDSNGYAEWSGTSFSTPMVAGAVALLLEKYPGLDPDEVRNLLTSTAQPDNNPPEMDGLMGAGVLDVDALTQALAVNRQSLNMEKIWGFGRVRWSHVAGATHYDLVRGDLAMLRGNTGTLGLLTCLTDDDAHNAVWEFGEPASGQGFFYLMRDNGTDPEGMSYGDGRIPGGLDCGTAP